MSYKQALEALSVARSQKLDPTDDRKLKTSVRDVFNLYMSMNERKWAAKTIRKKNIVFSSKFSLIAEKAINAVRLSDFLNVCDAIHARAEYAALVDFCKLSEAILLFTRMRAD